MLSLGSLFAVRRMVSVGAAVLLGAAIAQAQTGSFSNSSDESSSSASSASYSSSSDFNFTDASAAEPASPSAAAGGGQYDNRSGGGGRHYAWNFGGGFNAPIGNDQPYISWGGNFTAGGGLHFYQEIGRASCR